MKVVKASRAITGVVFEVLKTKGVFDAKLRSGKTTAPVWRAPEDRHLCPGQSRCARVGYLRSRSRVEGMGRPTKDWPPQNPDGAYRLLSKARAVSGDASSQARDCDTCSVNITPNSLPLGLRTLQAMPDEDSSSGGRGARKGELPLGNSAPLNIVFFAPYPTNDTARRQRPRQFRGV